MDKRMDDPMATTPDLRQVLGVLVGRLDGLSNQMEDQQQEMETLCTNLAHNQSPMTMTTNPAHNQGPTTTTTNPAHRGRRIQPMIRAQRPRRRIQPIVVDESSP